MFLKVVKFMTCTFFGHKRTSEDISPILESTLIYLIKNKGVTDFLVGNNGDFDRLVLHKLQELKKTYKEISYTVVLAYLPKDIEKDISYFSVYPEELESVPKRFAIDKRNLLMVKKSNFAITYVVGPTGGAAKFKNIAEKHGLEVINLPDYKK